MWWPPLRGLAVGVHLDISLHFLAVCLGGTMIFLSVSLPTTFCSSPLCAWGGEWRGQYWPSGQHLHTVPKSDLPSRSRRYQSQRTCAWCATPMGDMEKCDRSPITVWDQPGPGSEVHEREGCEILDTGRVPWFSAPILGSYCESTSPALTVWLPNPVGGRVHTALWPPLFSRPTRTSCA